MVSIRFKFNKNKLRKAGKTEDELLAPFREHARKYGIEEIEPGYFEKDGENALASITLFVVTYSRENPEYVTYFDEWILDDGDTVEDCAKEMRKILKRDKVNA